MKTVLSTNAKKLASDPRILVHLNLNDLVTEYCSKNKVSQNEVARRSGLSTSCLANYLSGSRYPRPDHMRALCTALGAPIGALFTEIGGA